MRIDFFSISYEDRFTTSALEILLNQDQDPGSVLFREEDGHLLWMDNVVHPHVYYQYLPSFDAQLHIMPPYEEFPDFADPAVKRTWIPYHRFYRCAETGGLWALSSSQYIIMGIPNDYVDILDFHGSQVHWDRYVVTLDEYQEDPSLQEFEYYKAGDSLTITGVHHYCERLHIPAFIDGMPVTSAYLSNSMNICHVRELVVDEGVQKLDFCWALHSLKDIQLPESTVLVRPPHAICQNPWYLKQPNGPVYFQNYYCGTKGLDHGSTLQLRNGTVGVIQWADYDIKWQNIILPASLTYISDFSFDRYDELDHVEFPRGTELLKECFKTLYPEAANLYRRILNRKYHFLTDSSSAPHLPTGFDLYNLADSHPDIRKQIPRSWMPTAPKLSYKDGWLAEFLYCSENGRYTGYYVSVDLTTGQPRTIIQLDQNARRRSHGYRTESYRTPYFLMAEEYLNACVTLLQKNIPSAHELDDLEQWWYYLLSDSQIQQYTKLNL